MVNRFTPPADNKAPTTDKPLLSSCAGDPTKPADGTYTNATIVMKDGKIVSVEQGTNVIYQAAKPCCPTTTNIVTPNGEIVQFKSTNCILVSGVGTAADPIELTLDPDCVPAVDGLTLDQCGTKVVKGLVKTLAKPVVKLISSDGSVTLSNGGLPDANCEVDVKAVQAVTEAGKTTRLFFSSCGAAVLSIDKSASGDYTVFGGSWERHGGTNSSINFSAGPYPTLAAAQAAMNSATLTCTNAAGVGGPDNGGP